MNVVAAVPQLDADFFYEKGLPKFYQTGNMNILKKIQPPSNAIDISEDPNNAIHISVDGSEIQNNMSTSVSDSVPGSVPPPDFPSVEFIQEKLVIVQKKAQTTQISIRTTQKNLPHLKKWEKPEIWMYQLSPHNFKEISVIQ